MMRPKFEVEYTEDLTDRVPLDIAWSVITRAIEIQVVAGKLVLTPDDAIDLAFYLIRLATSAKYMHHPSTFGPIVAKVETE